MPHDSTNISSDFRNYHRNHYYLELNNAWISSLIGNNLTEEEKNVQVVILEFIKNKLQTKNQIDELLLDRKTQIHANSLKLDEINSRLFELQNTDKTQQAKKPHQIAYTTSLKDCISEVNAHRLDMVWSRTFIEVMISFFGSTVPELKSLIAIIALANGFASYGFYLLRGGVDALPAIKHMLPHEKYDEHGITLLDRLAFQTEQRYQRIINDLVLWAPVNFITFHYWTGNGWLGFAGNLLTAVLLLGDYSLNYYVYYDKIRQFNLITKELEAQFSSNPYFKSYHQALKFAHEKALSNIDFEMKYQLCLVAAFIVLWSPFCLNSMIFTVIGAVACFGLQLFVNQRQIYLNYAQETCENQKKIMFYEGLNRLLVQLAIPLLYLVTGLCIMPMFPMISASMMFVLSTTLIAMLVKINDDCLALYKAQNKTDSMIDEIQTSVKKVEDDLLKLASVSAIIAATVIGMVKYSVIALNPSLAISLGIGLLSYGVFEYLVAIDKADVPVLSCFGV